MILTTFLVFPAIVAGLIAFGTKKDPMPMPGIVDAFAKLDDALFPALQNCASRDGAALHYRFYPSENRDSRVALLIHGSASDSRAMHGIAQALQQRGISSYALDIRGHGATGKSGDISYVGQLEDDLVDILHHVQAIHPEKPINVVAHSAGGGFALRFAGSKYGNLVDHYVVAAPFIHHAISTTRKGTAGWAVPYLPRIIGLSILDSMRLRIFQHLPVIAFAVPSSTKGLTAKYSFRLQSNFRPHMRWQGDLKNIQRPVTVLVGELDEMFVASAYAPLLEPMNKHIKIKVLAGVGHFGMYMDKIATDAIADSILA